MLFLYSWRFTYAIIHLNVKTVTPKSARDCFVNNALP